MQGRERCVVSPENVYMDVALYIKNTAMTVL
jgi:hypothetical protein